jgi:hypothetical protein
VRLKISCQLDATDVEPVDASKTITDEALLGADSQTVEPPPQGNDLSGCQSKKRRGNIAVGPEE